VVDAGCVGEFVLVSSSIERLVVGADCAGGFTVGVEYRGECGQGFCFREAATNYVAGFSLA
jgi:hypothetical protein